MEELVRINKILYKAGQDYKLIILKNEVVVCEVPQIRENIVISDVGDIHLEMSNGVRIQISEESLEEYLEKSVYSTIEEKIINVWRMRYPDQGQIPTDELWKYMEDEEFLEKYISGCRVKTKIER